MEQSAHPTVIIQCPGRTPIHLSVRGAIEIGRECSGVLLNDPQMSRRHAELSVSDGNVVLTDLGSTNGVIVHGDRVDVPVVLTPGLVARCGQTTIELERSTPRRRTYSTIDIPSQPTVGPGNDQWLSSIEIVADAVRSEPATYEPQAVTDDKGTLTIVFSDIESSTERAVALGDKTWMSVLAAHNQIIREEVKRYGGTEVKSQGDGFMLSFPGARRALQCMIDVQRAMSEAAATDPTRGVRIRVGAHTGEAIADDEGDLFGRHVIMASRVADLAGGGEILASSLVREIVVSHGDIRFGDARSVQLKGIEGRHTVYPVAWETNRQTRAHEPGEHPME